MADPKLKVSSGDRFTGGLWNKLVERTTGSRPAGDRIDHAITLPNGTVLTARKSFLPTRVGILDGALSAATNATNSPATATLSIYSKNSSGNLADSGDDLTVTNRFTEISEIASGTLLVVYRVPGFNEWWPLTSDCGATTT